MAENRAATPKALFSYVFSCEGIELIGEKEIEGKKSRAGSHLDAPFYFVIPGVS